MIFIAVVEPPGFASGFVEKEAVAICTPVVDYETAAERLLCCRWELCSISLPNLLAGEVSLLLTLSF